MVQLCNKQIVPSPSAASLAAPASIGYSSAVNVNPSPSQPNLNKKNNRNVVNSQVKTQQPPQLTMSADDNELDNLEPTGIMITQQQM